MDSPEKTSQPSAVEAQIAGGFQPPRAHARRGLNLFWRTFIMMAMLLTFSTLGWLLSVRSVDLEPRARQTAQQIASLVNLSRAALIYSDTITRYALIKTLADEEGVRILPREPGDKVLPLSSGQMADRITQELRSRLGEDTIVARSVNGESGLWIGFDIDDDPYWLLIFPEGAIRIANLDLKKDSIGSFSLSLSPSRFFCTHVPYAISSFSVSILYHCLGFNA